MADSKQNTKFVELTLDSSSMKKVDEANSSSSVLQVSAHSIQSQSYIREASFIFPPIDFKSSENLIVIPTMQNAAKDLVKVGTEIEQEKDRLLNTFFEFAKSFCGKIKEAGGWADYIDPCSGLPMITDDCNKVFHEVQSAEVLLNYDTMNCGCCKILLHPKWGSSVYPASIFTTASKELVTSTLSSFS